jgi:hypothetical protein
MELVAATLNEKSLFFQRGFYLRKVLEGFFSFFCDPAGIRTQDHYIKSVMLYQLSYGIITFGTFNRFL